MLPVDKDARISIYNSFIIAGMLDYHPGKAS
jgi:hypothetical protein